MERVLGRIIISIAVSATSATSATKTNFKIQPGPAWPKHLCYGNCGDDDRSHPHVSTNKITEHHDSNAFIALKIIKFFIDVCLLNSGK